MKYKYEETSFFFEFADEKLRLVLRLDPPIAEVQDSAFSLALKYEKHVRYFRNLLHLIAECMYCTECFEVVVVIGAGPLLFLAVGMCASRQEVPSLATVKGVTVAGNIWDCIRRIQALSHMSQGYLIRSMISYSK